MPSSSDAIQSARTTMDIDFGNGRRVVAEVFLEADRVVPAGNEGGWSQRDASALSRLREGRDAVLEQAAPTIGVMAGWVHDQVLQMGPRAPDRVGVDMGVKLVAKSSGIVAPVIGQLGGEMTLLVRLEWDVRPPDTAQAPRSVDDDDDEVEAPGTAG